MPHVLGPLSEMWSTDRPNTGDKTTWSAVRERVEAALVGIRRKARWPMRNAKEIRQAADETLATFIALIYAYRGMGRVIPQEDLADIWSHRLGELVFPTVDVLDDQVIGYVRRFRRGGQIADSLYPLDDSGNAAPDARDHAERRGAGMRDANARWRHNRWVAEALARVLDFLAARTRAERLRSRLAHYADLHAKLPENSEARERLRTHLDVLASKLIELEIAELSRRRDWGKIVTGIIMTGLFAVGAVVAIRAGGWWMLTLIITVPFVLAGISSIVSDVRGHPRESSTDAQE